MHNSENKNLWKFYPIHKNIVFNFFFNYISLVFKHFTFFFSKVAMIDVHEWDWDSISHILTPSNLKKLLQNSTPASAEYFLRVKSLVFFHMFQTLDYKIMNFRKNQKSLDIIRKFFELDLMKNGFIPDIPQNNTVVSNDFFGFLNEKGKWIEWSICSVEVMRFYWDNMLQNVGTNHRKSIEIVCQKILSLLPGNCLECQNCHWKVPETSMHSDHVCIYCQCKDQEGVLKQFKNLPYLHFCKNTALKT